MSITYINTTRPLEVNSKIIEWDMKRAGLSIIKEYKLLSDNDITKLELMSKHDSDVAIGKRQIHDKIFANRFEKLFTEVMEEFMTSNNIEREYDTISIKKDACFVINKDIKKSEFGKYIKFIPKNTYSSYLYLIPFHTNGNTLEIYIDKEYNMDIKGLISDKKVRDEIMIKHENGILNFIISVIRLISIYGIKSNKIHRFLHSFIDLYKNKELDYDYYREFNIESRFRYQFMGAEAMADYMDDKMLKKTNIEYNYLHIILPIVNLVV